MAKLIEHKRPLSANPFNFCKINIIIPFHGEYNHVCRLVESIWKHTWTNTYNIILVDDCSKNTSLIKNLKEVKTITSIRMEKQSGFSSCVNAALKTLNDDYVCIMHSDVEIQHPNWLSAMGESLLKLKSSGVKMIVAKSDNPLNEHPGLKAAQRGKTDDIVGTDFLPLYCALSHRKLFDKVGLLAEYPYAWYEDENLYWRMKKQGYKQVICGDSWVHHVGQLTINSLWKNDPKIKDVMDSNYEKCVNDIKMLFN